MSKKTYIIVTAVEPNSQHGTGNFLRQICQKYSNDRFIFFRGLSIYNNFNDLPGWHKQIPDNGKLKIYDILKVKILRPVSILVFPYFPNTVQFAIYLKKIINVKLITYLLDDQNILNEKINNDDIKKLFTVSHKIFSVSDEMTNAYKKKFKIKISTLHPKIVNPGKYFQHKFIPSQNQKISCAMLGNIWSSDRLKEIGKFVKKHKLRVRWFGLGPDAPWLQIDKKYLRQCGIICKGYLPEEQLFSEISKFPFILMPSGDLDKFDQTKSFSKYSMPSRLFFCCSQTNTPLFVLGHKKNAISQFVEKNKIGFSSTLKEQKIFQKIKKTCSFKYQKIFSCNIYKKKSLFIDPSLPQKLLDPN